MRIRPEEERALEASGQIYELQLARFLAFQSLSPSKLEKFDIDGLLSTEAKMRENTQREMALKDELATLEKKRKHRLRFFRSAFRSTRLLNEISTLGEHYSILEMRWSRIRASFKDSPFTRGIDLWRSDSRWYMHRVLRQDCAERGGCCERSCGCCLRRELSERRFAGGHCTAECHCCKKARRPQTNTESKRSEVLEDSIHGISDAIPNHIWYASLLGLMPGSNSNPFHLIDDAHVRYE